MTKWLTIKRISGEVVLVKCSQDAEGEIVIPENVTIIDVSAFTGCCGITSIIVESDNTVMIHVNNVMLLETANNALIRGV